MAELTTEQLILNANNISHDPNAMILDMSRRLQQQADEIDGWRKRVLSLEVDYYDLEVQKEDARKGQEVVQVDLDRAEEALYRIKQWADAYPKKVFREIESDEWKAISKLLIANGFTLDRISASNMRHVLKGIKGFAIGGLGE